MESPYLPQKGRLSHTQTHTKEPTYPILTRQASYSEAGIRRVASRRISGTSSVGHDTWRASCRRNEGLSFDTHISAAAQHHRTRNAETFEARNDGIAAIRPAKGGHDCS